MMKSFSHQICTILAFVGITVSCLDIPNIAVGGVHLKVAYVVFPLYLPIILYTSRMRIGASRLVLYALVVALFLPPVLFSTDITVSISYYFGIIICLIVMESMYRLTMLLQVRMIDILIWFYRVTVIVTAPLVFLHLQTRGHFTFYEASYWAIALIPYYCIIFYRLLTRGVRASAIDGAFLLGAIVLSRSLSMVLWCLVSFAFIAIRLKKVGFGRMVGVVAGLAVLFAFAYAFNTRTQETLHDLISIDNWRSLFAALIFMAGNRVQRVLVAVNACRLHPILGVGPGALTSYAMKHFQRADFSILGVSSGDFKLSQPATNVFLQLWAETGVVGTVSYLSLLVYVFRKVTRKAYALPMEAALWVTMLSLMIESSYIRTYVWMLYGIAIGVAELGANRASTGNDEVSETASP